MGVPDDLGLATAPDWLGGVSTGVGLADFATRTCSTGYAAALWVHHALVRNQYIVMLEDRAEHWNSQCKQGPSRDICFGRPRKQCA